MFEQALAAEVRSWGKRVMGWNSLRAGPATRAPGGASNTALVYWKGALTAAAAAAGIDGVAAAEEHSYLDSILAAVPGIEERLGHLAVAGPWGVDGG